MAKIKGALSRLSDKVSDWLDTVVMYAVALWLLFVTLPSLDKTITLSDGTKLHPSRGTPGSCYVTADGQHYVRTGRGTRKVGKQLGERLIARSIKIRKQAIARRIVLVFTVLLIVSSLALLAN